MFLHMGCGNVAIEGFVNIDCRETEATDMVADAWDLPVIQSGTVEYIYARHMLEHLGIAEAKRAVLEWRRVLADGGIMHIVVPNIEFHASQILGLALCEYAEDQEWHAMAGFYGWQNPNNGGTQEDTHRWGYTPASLERLLTGAGLTITDDGFEQLVEADSAPWHINMRAMKGQDNEPSQTA